MSDTRASLGGKGANLVRLARAGLPVPAFVVVDTQEYREFVRARGLDDVIDAALAAADHDVGSGGDAAAAAALTASQTIRAAFAGTLPTGQRIRLSDTVAELGDVPVAVRSSATAEDLPDLSFAGQQDSFLNVTGTSDVLASIVACWSSLWTDRAIHYRARAGIPSRGLAIAVVVQAMVPAEAAGVLFTADPVSGHRGHTMIDAVFGLGEGLVAGQVTPDSYHVDRARRAIRRTLQGPEPTLTDPQIWRLVDLGARIEEVFGSPQDVEWVRVGEELYVVQSRPITSLYPLAVAARELPEPSLWLSFGAVQGMLEPITPLGQDVLALLVCGAARVFGGRPDYRTTTAIQSAGERLWIRVDTLLRSPIGRPVLTRFLPLAEPGAAAVVARLAEEPAFARRGMSAAGPHLLTGARFGRRVAPYLPVTLAQPERTVATLHRQAEAFVEEVADQLAAAGGQPEESARLAARVQVLTREGTRAMGVLLPLFGRVMPVGLALVGRLRAVAAHTGLPEADALALAVLRALPGNVTTDMNVALWDVAQAIRFEPDALVLVAHPRPGRTDRRLSRRGPAAGRATRRRGVSGAVRDAWRRRDRRGRAAVAGRPRTRAAHAERVPEHRGPVACSRGRVPAGPPGCLGCAADLGRAQPTGGCPGSGVSREADPPDHGRPGNPEVHAGAGVRAVPAGAAGLGRGPGARGGSGSTRRRLPPSTG
ncbi:MAG: hypothetical protein IPL37_02745 [Austwickia sp.]|nr:hypothetical protein [Austwickia sp.]